MGRKRADIGLVISDLGDGGAQRVFVQLAAHWNQAGRKVVAITQAPPESDFFTLPAGVERLCSGGLGTSSTLFSRLLAVVRRHWSLRRSIKRADVPVVVAFVGRTAISTIVACWGLGVSVVISERNDPSVQKLGPGWDLLRRWLYGRADVVTANSRGALDSMRAYVPSSRLLLVPNPVLLPPIVNEAARKDLFLAVGRLTEKKGFDILIRAFAAIAGELPGWNLSIAGRGEQEQELRDLAAELSVATRVMLLGLVTDLSGHYDQAGVFVLPSRHEGMPNALLEAMASGLPVIVSDNSPGPLELVENEKSGLVVRGNDPSALAEAMLTMARDPDLRKCLGAAARDVTQQMTPEAVFAQWDRAVGLAGGLAAGGHAS